MTRHRLLPAALGLLLLAGTANPTLAQIAPAPDALAAGGPAARTLTAAERAQVLADIRKKVAERYVFPERRAAIVDRLKKAEKSGRYNLDRPDAFVQAVTEDLKAASNDGHMYLLYDPAQFAARSAAKDDSGDDAFFTAMALRDNHGLIEMRILPGNVRYLKIGMFHWVNDKTGQAYDDAMRFLQGGDAIVIDLRGNGGGSSAAVNYLTSHFVAADTLLLTFHEAGQTPSQSRALSHLPAGRVSGKPLYVLTDRGTGSAAEEFADHARLFKFGELVGTTTGGAANNNDLLPIAPAFVLSLSYGAPVHAVDGGNWEGVGVVPDVETAPEAALDTAIARALRKLSDAPGADRARYAWSLVEIEARLKPPAVPAERLQGYAGQYGPATVALRNGSLWFSRPNRPERRLYPLDDQGLFGLEGVASSRVRFNADGLEILPQQGAPQALKRQ